MDKKACDYFLNQGYSCSESIVMAAAELGLLPSEYVNCATSFSGGMSSGCLCGAAAGAQIVLGYLYGKNKTNEARALAKKFVEEFKKANGATCCRVLTSKFEDFHSKERKNHCSNMVQSSAKILTKILSEEKIEVK